MLATERNIHNWLHDSVSFMSICTFSLSAVKWMVVVPLFDFHVPFFIFSRAGKTGWPDCAKMSVFNRVVVPRLFGSGLNVASTSWLEIYGEFGNLLSAVDAHLLVASSVQFNVVEHAHEDGAVWQILRRRIHPLFRDELLISLKFSHHEFCC